MSPTVTPGVPAIAVATTILLLTATVSRAHDRDDRDDRDDDPPVRIEVQAPDSGNFRGITTNTGWSLIVRVEAPDAVAIVEAAEEPTQPVGRREAIVLTDPDGCIDMRHFPITHAGVPYEDCVGPDETYLEFTTERFDTFDLADGNTGNFQVRAQLVDDAFASGALLDKPYLRTSSGAIAPVPRPQTGGNLLDGYGFGPDDDMPGLVVMSDYGAARVFDENFDRTRRVIRNMAGFANGVSQELRARKGGPALVVSMQVVAGMFEPIALFDLDVDAANADYLRRLESGPIEARRFATPPIDDDDVLRQITASYSPYPLELRIVVVDGVAPTFIEDMNRDRQFTTADLRRMGFEPLSNEARLRLLVTFDLPVTETITGRTCPPPSLLFRDLDGNGRDGAIACSGSGGAARIRRRPL